MFKTIQYFAHYGLHFPYVVSASYGHGIKALNGRPGNTACLLLAWRADLQQPPQRWEPQPDAHVDLQQLLGKR